MARQAVALQEFLAKLHPAFDDCPSPCERTIDDARPVDLPRYCSECEVSKQIEFFELACASDLARRFEEGECLYSFEQLERDVFEAMRRARTSPTYPPGVDALTARAIDVVRREQDRPRRVADWEWAQKRAGQNG